MHITRIHPAGAAFVRKTHLKPAMTASAHTVPVLRKAIRVLEAIAEASEHVTAKGLALTLGISPTTCYRILQSFVAEGWLRPGADGTFELSVGLTSLFRPLLRHEILIESVSEPLASLAKTTGLTAKITVRQGNSAVTIHSENPPVDGAVISRVGSANSLAIGSSGAVFLSVCPHDEVTRLIESAPAYVWRFQKRTDALHRVREARREGTCYDHGSYETSIRSLSAPLFGPSHELLAVVTLLGSPRDIDPAVRPALEQKLKATVNTCTQFAVGHAPAA
jgi:DNA-binding IclR family transcriptional regulator